MRTAMGIFGGAAVAALVGCGGRFVIDVDETGGAAGDDAPEPPAFCEALCDTEVAAGCFEASERAPCVSECEQIVVNAGPCAPEYVAFGDCLVAVAPGECGSEAACPGEADLYRACLYPEPCGTPTCAVVGAQQSCEMTCADGSTFESACGAPGAPHDCTCSVDGVEVGSCDVSDAADLQATANLYTGCCAGVFASQ